VSTAVATVPIGDFPTAERFRFPRAVLIKTLLVFCVSYVVLFLPMSLRPNQYDESLILTGAMRVAAGQIPHRDFYANYGPAQFYLLAALFKFFGPSIFVERLLDLFVKSALVAFIYLAFSRYLRESVLIAACAIAVLWIFGLLDTSFGLAITPVALLNLVASVLVLSAFRDPIPKREIFAAGAVAGLAALFRYDTGIALVLINACVIAVAFFLITRKSARFVAFVSVLAVYFLGFAVAIVPPALYYLAVAPAAPFIHDIFIYPSKYYHAGRNLPFPGFTFKQFDNMTIYVIILIVALSFGVAIGHFLRARRAMESNRQSRFVEKDWCAVLITFGFLALGMYSKGLVRVALVHFYLAIIPSLLLLAMLFGHKAALPRAIRASVIFLAVFFACSAGWSALRELKNLRLEHSSWLENAWHAARGARPELAANWCRTPNPITRNMCFLPDDDHIRTIEFIAGHTKPEQTLFVGLPRHDKIFANDNLIYFAAQRLPATRWSHFDPDLQNRADIQRQMILDLDLNAPPYLIRDSEFEIAHEPNDSSKSSGVTLLDDYLALKYQPVQTFGELSIWRRTAPIS
jgi:hypothetical protein